MAETLVPDEVTDGATLFQIGTIYQYVVIDWGVPVGLSGIPPIVLNDGLGNDYLPEKAAPKIAEQARWVQYTILRYQSVPRFAQLEITIPSGITVIQNAGGDTPAPDTVIVDPVPPVPPPPP